MNQHAVEISTVARRMEGRTKMVSTAGQACGGLLRKAETPSAFTRWSIRKFLSYVGGRTGC